MAAIYLGLTLLAASSNLPAGLTTGPAIPAYLVLQAVGFAVPSRSLGTRCALTAPFHHCQACAFGCVLSVALSIGSPRVAVSHHRALSCPDFPPTLARQRPSDPLACFIIPRFHPSCSWIQPAGTRLSLLDVR